MNVEETKMLRAGTLWFPLAMVASMVIFVATFSWVASSERAEIHGRINGLTTAMQSLSTTVERLAVRIGQPDTDALTRSAWLVECLQLQIANPGFMCPYGANRLSVSPWRAQTLNLAEDGQRR